MPRHAVNFGAYMDFKRASNALFHRVGHADLAKSLDISVAAIRQARLNKAAKACRPPPRYWQNAIIVLAQRRISELRALINRLRETA